MPESSSRPSPFDLTGKSAVVLGGTSGIGLAIANGLSDAGASVLVSSSQASRVQAAQQDAEKRGSPLRFARCDVRSRAELEDLQRQLTSDVGQVDIVVNAAGVLRRQPTLELSEETLRETFEVNVVGTLLACQVFGSQMIQRREGSIINIASLNTFVSLTQVTAYAASKAAVGAITKSLATEWGPLGVRVNAIAPGVLRTKLNAELLDSTARGAELLMRTPMNRFGEPHEIAGAAVFLASEAASFVNGEILVVDGGFLASGVSQ